MPQKPPQLSSDSEEFFRRFVQWESRLRAELPAVLGLLEEAGARTVLDAGCGEGQHAVALAAAGYDVTGLDLDAESLGVAAREYPDTDSLALRFVAGDFRLAPRLGPYDAVISMGNSLGMPNDPTTTALAIQALGLAVKPGGAMLLHVVNGAALTAEDDGTLLGPVREVPDEKTGAEALVAKFFLPGAPGHLRGNLLRLSRDPATRAWQADLRTWRMTAITPDTFRHALAPLDGWSLDFRGNLDGRDYDPATSPNIVCMARRLNDDSRSDG